MAKFEKGILGGFSGRVGTIVGATWRGLDIMRSRPKRTQRAATDEQLSQRARFGLIAKFLRPMRPVLRDYFGQPSEEKSKSNLATSYHMLEAVSGSYPNFTIDFPRVVVSKGELLGLENTSVTPQAGALLKVNWNDNSGQGEAQTTDNMFLVVYSEQKNTSLFRVEAAARTIGSFVYALPATWTGDTVHCWISVASEQNKKYGNSEYFGPLVVV